MFRTWAPVIVYNYIANTYIHTGKCCINSSRISMSSSVLSAGSFSRHSLTVSRTMRDWKYKHEHSYQFQLQTCKVKHEL